MDIHTKPDVELQQLRSTWQPCWAILNSKMVWGESKGNLFRMGTSYCIPPPAELACTLPWHLSTESWSKQLLRSLFTKSSQTGPVWLRMKKKEFSPNLLLQPQNPCGNRNKYCRPSGWHKHLRVGEYRILSESLLISPSTQNVLSVCSEVLCRRCNGVFCLAVVHQLLEIVKIIVGTNYCSMNRER